MSRVIADHSILCVCDQQIDEWQNMYKQMDQIESSHMFRNWLRLDLQRFKHAVLNECCKWGYMLKQHLVEHLTNTLEVR